jgi:hypothetical protein
MMDIQRRMQNSGLGTADDRTFLSTWPNANKGTGTTLSLNLAGIVPLSSVNGQNWSL